MKKNLLVLLTLGTFSAFAGFEGAYEVTDPDSCPKFNAVGLTPIRVLGPNAEIYIREIELNDDYHCSKEELDGILKIVTYAPDRSESTVLLYKNSCDHDGNKYLEKGKFRVTENKISFATKGTEIDRCELIGGITRPCLRKWDEKWSLELHGQKLTYSWYVSGKSGQCTLTRKY